MTLQTLKLAHAGVAAEIVPERGAIVTTLAVLGVDVLFLDPSTLSDPSKNVRGGIPVLFPFAGKLVDGRFGPAGTTMGQHGFGRNKPWPVREQREDMVRVGLAQDGETGSRYPYAYDAEYTVQLLPRGLQVELLVRNSGEAPLPLSPGWHPYFRCPAAGKAEVTTDVPGLRPAEQFSDEREFDFGVEAPAAGRARFTVPGIGGLRLSFSPLMRHLQLWSQPGRDFVCLEPFLGPNDTINTDRRLDLPPGQARDFWMRIEVEP